MKIYFKNIILHNFGSYAHAEIDLTDKGFCAVSGENHYAKDNALSNGSGKSMIWSAICYALTGETLQGLKTNLKNIFVDVQEQMYVELTFTIDNDEYVIKRGES